MARRILVTGASGFLGQALCPLLVASGYEVHAVGRKSQPKASGIIWHKADLLKAGASDALISAIKPEALVALAWHMAPGNAAAAENIDWIGSSVALINAFYAKGGRRALVCGSCAEYDWSAANPFSEQDTPLGPSSAYGKAKLDLFKKFTDICAASRLSGVWLRPFFLYGRGEARHRLVADVIISLAKGQPAVCSSGEQRRDYLHIYDAATAIVKLLNSDATGAVNIGSGSAIAVKDLIMEIARQFDAPNLVQLGARATPANDPDIIEADISRLLSLTDWAPRYDLQTGVADTIAWWKAELAKDREIP